MTTDNIPLNIGLIALGHEIQRQWQYSHNGGNSWDQSLDYKKNRDAETLTLTKPSKDDEQYRIIHVERYVDSRGSLDISFYASDQGSGRV